MGLPGGVTALLVIGIVLDGIGLILHIAGIATSTWSVINDRDSYVEFGVFKICNLLKCFDFSDISEFNFYKDGWKATQALVIVGLLCAVAAVVLAMVHIVVAARGKLMKILTVIAGLFNFLACVVIISAVVIWAVVVNKDLFGEGNLYLNTSVFLCIGGAILMFISGILMIVESTKRAVLT